MELQEVRNTLAEKVALLTKDDVSATGKGSGIADFSNHARPDVVDAARDVRDRETYHLLAVRRSNNKRKLILGMRAVIEAIDKSEGDSICCTLCGEELTPVQLLEAPRLACAHCLDSASKNGRLLVQ